MATNEASPLNMLLRPQSAAPSSQARAQVGRDAPPFSQSLDSAYQSQRTEARERPADRGNDKPSLNTNNERQLEQHRSRAKQRNDALADARHNSRQAQDRLTARQKETLNRLEPVQRKAVKALPPEQQAQVLDDIAERAESGLGAESLSAILEQLDPQWQEQLLALMQSLADQASAGADVDALQEQIDLALEAEQIPPELAAWLANQMTSSAHTPHQAADALAGRLEALQTTLRQAFGEVKAQTTAAVNAKDADGNLNLTEQGKTPLNNGQASFGKTLLQGLGEQREQGALLETAKLHNLLAGRGESSERSTAGSITALIESLGLSNRALTTATNTRVAAQVLPGFNQSGWGDAVGQKVLWMARQNITSADLRLDPPDLGTIHVRVSIQNDQAQISFSSAQPVVREALDQHSARLREMLAEQGMTQVDVDVSDQRSFAESDSRAGDQQHSRGGNGSSSNDNAEAEQQEAPISITRLSRMSIIDHYA